MLLTFRMLSDEDDNFLRDYQVPDDFSLLEFHNFICQDLHYDPTNMTSFFASNGEWEKVREFTLLDMGLDAEEDPQAPGAMENTLLSDIIHRLHDRLIYQFDMLEDRALYLEMRSVEHPSGAPKPKVMAIHGEAPDQLDPTLSPVNRSIFEEAMSDYGDSDEYDDFDSYESGGHDE